MRTGVLATAVVLAATACGPITASTAISRAQEEFRTAALAGADTAAPYEYTEADLLLRMARECEGRAEFQAAQVFAENAAKLAQEGKQNTPRNLKQRELREAARKLVPLQAPAASPAPAPAPAPQPGANPGGKR